MLSRAMSQRSVMIRPATQATGGMMQYLLTIVVILVIFWAVAIGLYFAFGRKKATSTTEAEEYQCAPAKNGTLLANKQIICSMRSDKAENTYVKIPGGICHIYVATDLVDGSGRVRGGTALNVELLQSLNRGDALVSVPYDILKSQKDTFIPSLQEFMKGPPHRFRRSFTGIEVRSIPLAEVNDAVKMNALDDMIKEVTNAEPKVKTVIATVDIPYGSTGTIAKPNLPSVAIVVAFIHYDCQTPYTARAPNDKTHITSMNTAILSGWGRPCLSVNMAGLYFGKTSAWGQPAGECRRVPYCTTFQYKTSDPASGSMRSPTTNADAYAFDSKETMQRKAELMSQNGCIYVDQIEYDHEDCQCKGNNAHFEPYPLLRAIYEGMK